MSAADSRIRRSPWKLHPRMWILFGLLTGLAVAFTAWQQWVFERRYRAVEARNNQLQSARQALERRIGPHHAGALGWQGISVGWGDFAPLYIDLRAPLQSLRLCITTARATLERQRSPTREEVERTLNTSLPCRLNDTILLCEHVDEEGIPFLLSFHRGRLYDVTIQRAALPKLAEYPLYSDTLAEAWSRALKYDHWLLLTMAGAAALHRKHRVFWAELLVMAAMARIMIRWPRLGSSGLREYISADFLPWGLVVLTASICVLTWAYYSSRDRSLVRCRVCDYNLIGGSGEICPECGTPVSADLRERIQLAAQLRGSAARSPSLSTALGRVTASTSS